MLPGAGPPVKEPEPVNIGFDIPAEARTLQSANKVRQKFKTQQFSMNVGYNSWL